MTAVVGVIWTTGLMLWTQAVFPVLSLNCSVRRLGNDHSYPENKHSGFVPGISITSSHCECHGSTKCNDCTYSIHPCTNLAASYCVDNRNHGGTIKTIRPLDRESHQKDPWITVMRRTGSGHSPGDDIVHYNVSISDENDNAPELNLTTLSITRDPNFSAEFHLFDRDGGKPANMTARLYPAFMDDFTLKCSSIRDGNISLDTICNITSKHASKGLHHARNLSVNHLPINVSDGENSAIRYVPIYMTRGQGVNDSQCTYQVFCYECNTTLTVGRVYVNGMDTENEKYEYRINRDTAGFTVDADGLLFVNLALAKLQRHNLEVTVTNPSGESAVSHIQVDLIRVTSQEIRNAGSVRIQNVEPEIFILTRPDGKSQYGLLRDFLAEKFNVPSPNVSIFSVMSEGRHPAVTQLYFTLTGNSNRSSTFLNGFLSMYTDELEKALGDGAKVLQVGVNDCVFEGCENGCVNMINVTAEEAASLTLYSTDEQNLAIIPISTTAFNDRCYEPPMSCLPNPCYNGGICHSTDTGPFCECRAGGRGPQCQGRIRSFHGAGSFVWLDPIKPCDRMHIHFHFMTRQETSILLYNGPMSNDTSYYSNSDFIALYIREKNVTMEINFGEQSFTLNSNVNVNDGRWHEVDVILFRKKLIMSVDKEKSASKSIRGSLTQLNVNAPLQVGGMVTAENGHKLSSRTNLLSIPSFSGCIRDFSINGLIADLANPAHSNNSEPGCSQVDSVCMTQDGQHCVHGLCVSSMMDTSPKCICDTGYTGDRCNEKVQWRLFQRDSYVQYMFSQEVLGADHGSFDISMLVMPKEKSGALFSAAGNSGMQLKLDDWRLVYQTTNEAGATNGANEAATYPVELKKAQPYLVQLRRNPVSLILSLDQFRQPFTTSSDSRVHLNLDQDQVFVGAVSGSALLDFQGCIAQITYNNNPVPLPYDNFSSNISISNYSNVAEDCPHVVTCKTWNKSCPPPLACQDFWKGPLCTCPSELDPVFDENDDWIGCGGRSMTMVTTLGISKWALAVILVCFILLALLLALLLVFHWRRRVVPYSSLPASMSDPRQAVSGDDKAGAGERDNEMFDKRPIRVPIPGAIPRRASSLYDKNDEHHPYREEAPAETTGSLSTLPSEGESPEWSQVESWGPKFANVASIR